VALEKLQKMREEILKKEDPPDENSVAAGGEVEDGSCWETGSSKQQSQWSSSVVWSSWSKMERNKGVKLDPLEKAMLKEK
jgi:hypothetical protein